jgi:hypothetical protein
MFVRTTVLAAGALALALVLGSAARAKRPPTADQARPKGPTNLRITASGPTSISLAWDAFTSKSGN